jgi:hypothetical protein
MSRRGITGISGFLHRDSPSSPCGLKHVYIVRVLEQRQKESGKKEVDMSDVLDGFQKKARDHARVPVQASKSFML